MHKISTFVLRGVIYFLGAAVLTTCAVALPLAIRAELRSDFDYGPIFAGLYLPAIPFFYALYQALQLLKLIDKNKTFTQHAVNSFRRIKLSALLICGLFAAGMPYVFYVADRDDAPGVAAIGFVIIAASFVIAAFASLLQKIIQNAVAIKSENDLTV